MRRCNRTRCAALVSLAALAALLALIPLAWAAGAGAAGQSAGSPAYGLPSTGTGGGYPGYNMGRPVLADIFVSPTGNDTNGGATRAEPLQTLGAAWARIPEGELSGTGYRINLLPGRYLCEGDCANYFANRSGTYTYPIILIAADGSGTVTLRGGLNLYHVNYLYLLDLTLWAGGEAGAAFGNNVLHIEQGDHVLLRGLTLRGPQACLDDTCNDMQEVLKINQAQDVYLENSDLSGTHQTVLDYFAVQHGHVLDNRIGHSGGRCAYVKGGSAYLLFAGNEFYDCREAGFQAGEGSNLAFMISPWLHYEAYDVKAVNNVLHDIYGAGLTVAGGYNILLAYNTLYRVGLDDAAGCTWALVQLLQGGRGCIAAEEFGGGPGTQARCQAQLDAGGWGTALLEDTNGGYWIPNRHVDIYNNLFYNPPGAGTHYIQFAVDGPVTLPPQARHISNPSHTDDDLRVAGNLIWNQVREGSDLLGSTNGSTPGCGVENPTCNASQLAAENQINMVEPQLRDPAGGDFRPIPGSNVLTALTYGVPAFGCSDAPAPPVVPPGDLTNTVPYDRAGQPRPQPGPPGAYAPPAADCTQYPPPTPEPLWVEPVTSPTGLMTQTLWVTLGRGRAITATSEAGTTAVTGTFSTANAVGLNIPLQPLTVHHISVAGLVEYRPGCFYQLSTASDRHDTALVIVQNGSAGPPLYLPLLLNLWPAR
jgi:hypothetical protein